MIWATVNSRSCFCWLCRTSPSSAAKNIINLILVLTIWWCPCVEPSLRCWKRVFAMTCVFFWCNSLMVCPASFCTPTPNLSATSGVSWLPTFVFQSPMMKRGCNPVCISTPYIKKQRHYFVNIGPSSQGYGFSSCLCMDMRVGLWRKLSTEELMLLNCGVEKDSWEFLGLQGDQTSQS